MLYRTMCAVVRVAMIVHVVCPARAVPVFLGLFIYERVASGRPTAVRSRRSYVHVWRVVLSRRVGWRSAGHLVYNRTLVY